MAPPPTTPVATGDRADATPGRPAGRRRATSRNSATKSAPPKQPAVLLPVARVAVDISLSHLDRPFDYLVPAELADRAQPGVRVRVRFAGRLVDAYVLQRLPGTDHGRRLGYLERVVSPEPVLTEEIAALARAVADRYAGSLADVLRLAVPPRHARAESLVPATGSDDTPEDTPVSDGDGPLASDEAPAAGGQAASAATELPPGWADYPAGKAFLTAVRHGAPARAIWQALPGEDWPARLAEAAVAAHAAGRGALLVVPDARDLARLEQALSGRLQADQFVTLAADLGPAERYRRFLAVRRGRARIVAGTRAATFAPVTKLSLVAVFDDGDELLAEPRAPYPHAREILMMRSAAAGCALLIGGFARTAEAQLLVESGWAKELGAARATVRARVPRIEAQGDSYAVGADSSASRARLSPAAFTAARAAVAAGAPVLVQVPRRGYLPTMACAECRRPARCRRCHGPLGIAAGIPVPTCRWCGAPEAHFVCGACGGTDLRAVGQGASRTAEELGRAFPGVTLITSAGDSIRDTVPDRPAIVVATPGAEPVAVGGYGAALLLDGGSMLSRPDLRAAEETVRRWMSAAALVRPASSGGRVVLGVDGGIPAAQALIRWDPAWHAAAELAGRRELGFPPAVAMASLTGDEQVVQGGLADLELPDGAELLGPVEVEPDSRWGSRTDAPQQRALLRIAQPGRRQLATALKTMAAERSARKGVTPPRIQVDPAAL